MTVKKVFSITCLLIIALAMCWTYLCYFGGKWVRLYNTDDYKVIIGDINSDIQAYLYKVEQNKYFLIAKSGSRTNSYLIELDQKRVNQFGEWARLTFFVDNNSVKVRDHLLHDIPSPQWLFTDYSENGDDIIFKVDKSKYESSAENRPSEETKLLIYNKDLILRKQK